MITALPIGGLFIALAFVRINDVPLVNYVLFAVTYAFNPKRYIYQKKRRYRAGNAGNNNTKKRPIDIPFHHNSEIRN